jgi:hypothetical protein
MLRPGSVQKATIPNAQMMRSSSLHVQEMCGLHYVGSMNLTEISQDARTWLPQLGALANSRLKILIWVCLNIVSDSLNVAQSYLEAGDADIK